MLAVMDCSAGCLRGTVVKNQMSASAFTGHSRVAQRVLPRRSRRSEGSALTAKCVLHKIPLPAGGRFEELTQGKSLQRSLDERISSGEFSKKSIVDVTQPVRKLLSSMGPLGKRTLTLIEIEM